MSSNNRILVWDLPTRVFHWLMVLAFAGAWLAFDDDRYLYIHVYAGYTLLGLLVFRLIWGFVGSHYARFHSFAHDWPSVTAYLKGLLNGQAARYLGHNPAGSWAIFILLALGFVVTLSGMLTLGGEERHGPFAGLLSYTIAPVFREIHEISAWTMLVLVIGHIIGVIVESVFHRENLVLAMLNGFKAGGDSGIVVRPRAIIAVVLVLLVLLSAFFTFRGYLAQTDTEPYLPYKGIVLADNALWREECGDCHMAYHPSLLPARSWQAMMDGQNDHFGEELDLDADVTREITRFLLDNSAEQLLIEPSWRILQSLGPGQTPLRITATPYWKRKHEDIEQRYWDSDKVKDKGNCSACHRDADAGTYEDAAMRLPRL